MRIRVLGERAAPCASPSRLLAFVSIVFLAACGDSASTANPQAPAPTNSPPTDTVLPTPSEETDPTEAADCTEFDSTFEAIQTVVFENRGCMLDVCHGSSLAGNLDLRPDAAYGALFEQPSSGSGGLLIVPGDRERSVLYSKLVAAVRPETVEITGAPMPVGLPPLSENELEAVRLWIGAGAPETGTVSETATLLDACLPPEKPITIAPLAAPDPERGVQFQMPPIKLPAASEQEYCFATYYDFRGEIPERFLDPSGRFFRIVAQELRQDPVSHHLVLSHSGVPIEDIDDEAFPAWTCAGGALEGESCDPLVENDCGQGFCRTIPVDSFACIGFGPPSVIGLPTATRNIGGGQEPQLYQELASGVFGQVPLEGIAFWNTHAFNLTTTDHVVNGRLNLYFAQEQEYPVVALVAGGATFRPDAAPYTIETECASYTLPQGARLFSITSHYHKRGKRFWATLPDGTLIYENFYYSDPDRQSYDPPLAFDQPDAAERRITYCATFNNGVAEDGSPDPETVTRRSRMPEKGSTGFVAAGCVPTACATGRVGAACSRDEDCHTESGASDGWCDACAIAGGETTENEMFILLGQFYMAPGFDGPSEDEFLGVGF